MEKYTVREGFRDGDKQLEHALGNALVEWEFGDFTDAIPAVRLGIGCSCVATAFGGKDQALGAYSRLKAPAEEHAKRLN